MNYILVHIEKKEENEDMKVTIHCLVKNEDKWIWFALRSVLPYADKIFIYDTGSTDRTVEVIKTIKDKKIEFGEKGEVSKKELVKLRQEMIERTRTDWFLILDGDEIWPELSIKETIKAAREADENVIAIFNPVRNCIGDVFHYLSENSGRYQIGNQKGNLNIRLIRKNSTMKVHGEYPLEVYADKNGPIQNQENNIKFVDSWFLHTSFLRRSSKDQNKVSGSFGKKRIWQSGIKIKNEEMPEVFNLEYPKIINNPFQKRGFLYDLVSLLLEPLIILKRKIL